MKTPINPLEQANRILTALPKGVLLTTKAEGTTNTMVIGWGTLGIEWGKPIFIAYVRESRFSRTLLDKNPEFTVNIPAQPLSKEIIAVCGRQSGRDVDKFAACGLTPEEPEAVSVPGILQCPLTLECKVLYRREQDPALIPQDILDKAYGPQGDYHTVYYGEIVSAYEIT